MKINQYCSVCKKHLDMEVIPTDDGGDDGVIWLRCPECQGFLPKFTGEGLKPEKPAAPADGAAEATEAPTATEPAAPDEAATSSPSRRSDPAAAPPSAASDLDTDEDAGDETGAEAPAAPAEPVAEYAARLAAADTTAARPYRPSASYEVGDLILHLAYDDVGIVVAKERLPGGRQAIKVYFDGAGVMHLIEQAADGH